MKILAVLIEVTVQADQRVPLIQEVQRGVLVEGGSLEREAEGEDRRKDGRTDRRIDHNGKKEGD